MPVSPDTIAGAVATLPVPALPDAVATPPPEGPLPGAEQTQPELITCLDPDNPDRVYTQLPSDPVERGRILVEKDRRYSELKAQNDALLRIAQQPRTPEPARTADPAKQFIDTKVQRLTQRGMNPEAARVIAEDAWEDYRALNTDMERTQQQSRHEAFVTSNPILVSEIGEQVAESYARQTGRYFPDPETHLNAVIAHCVRSGIEIPAQYRSGVAPAKPAPLSNNAPSVAERAQQQQQAYRQPAGGGNGGSGNAPTGDTPEMLEAFRGYVAAFPRATQEQRVKAMANIRSTARGNQ